MLLALGLRVYKLAQVPVGLHGDEVGVGYNAYSLLTTGKDEYGVSWPIVLRADIPPLNFYLTSLSIDVLGKTDVAVRLPAVVYGVLGVWVTYVLAKKLFSPQIGILASLFLAISPWHVQASRIAHEANLGILLQIVGAIFFLKGLNKKASWLMGAAVVWGMSLYAYHGPRLTTPLLIIILGIIFRSKLIKLPRKWLVVGGLGFLLLVLPVAKLILFRPISENRFAGISILIRQATLKPARDEAKLDAGLSAAAFHNPILVYSLALGRQYMRYLDWDYLFFDSSQVRYFNVRNVGLMYAWDWPFLLAGIYYLVRRRKRPASKLALAWLAIAPLPGAVTLGEPNAGRNFMMLPVVQIITAIGWTGIWKKKWLAGWMKIVLAVGLMYSAAIFGHEYFVHSQQEFAAQWEYGLKQAAQVAVVWENQVDRIIFTDVYKEPYIYVLFYGNKSPAWFNQLENKQRHWFIGYSSFGKYQFRAIDWQKDKQLKRSLLVGTAEEIPAGAEGIVAEIMSPNNQTVVLRVVRT